MNSFNKPKNWAATRSLLKGAMFLVALLLLSSPGVKAQLSGTYTVCASGCDYSKIASAVSDLNSKGVSAPVTIDIRSGSYNENFTINSISGASSKNTITIKGAGKTTTRIYSTSSQIVYLNSTKWVTIKDLTIENTLTSGTTYPVYGVYPENCTIQNCWIKMPAYPNVTGYGIYHNYGINMTYDKNTITGGYMAMYIYDYGNSNCGNHKITNNVMTKWYYYGIYTYDYSHLGNNLFEGNYIDSSLSGGNGYAMYTQYENGATIRNNTLGAYVGSYSGFMCYYPNYTSSTYPFVLENNFIGGQYYPLYCYIYYCSNVKFTHNTIHNGYGSSQYVAYIYMYSVSGMEISNNSFTRPASGTTAYIYPASTTFNLLEGNNFYNGTNAGIVYNGTSYVDIKGYKTASGEKFAQSASLPLTSVTTDWHLDQSKPAPAGKFSGVTKDFDGDARCQLFPTVGADESTFGKSKPVVQIFGNSTVVYGSPTVFYNSAKQGEPKVHKWYIDGVYQTDSIHLETTKLTGPTNTIKLVTEGCGGKDSATFTVTITLPTKAPVSDFISDKNSILMGSVVNFYDLSTNGPSQWNWQIKPDSTYDFGLKVPTVKVTYGSLTTPKWSGRFNYPGKYQVCLTASNLKGLGNKECKVDYIEVIPAVNMGTNTYIRDAKGFLYDNGGPNGSPSYNNASSYTATIDPCADSVYLIVTGFELYCNYDYLQIFEGKDNTGRKLHKCTGNTGYYGKDGYTGSAQYLCANDCRPKKTDTFKAAKSMYIVLDIKAGVTELGIEAYWWSKPRSVAAPKAKYTSVDTICTNGVVAFTNASTGDELSYQWDLDGDPSFFESTSKNTTWPYFFPGQYKVTLITSNCGGVDTFTKKITVLDPPTPVVDFKADNTNPTTNDVVFFSSTTAQCVDNYQWIFTKKYGTGTVTFVNGTSAKSVSPQVVFSDTGLWSAEFKASNVTGSGNKVKKDYINVKGSYCSPSVSNILADIAISKVVFNSINNSSTSGVDGYQNFTPTVSTTIEIGVTYTLTMERNSNKNKANRTIWIDWNGDGDFDDAQEHVADENNSSALSWSYDITVPSFATVGATKMRLAINQSNYANKVCGQNEFGEYEDYRIYITPDLTAPVITRKGMDTVRVEQGFAYVDSGATAKDNLDGDITSKIKLTSAPTFNALIPGTYVFSYNVEDNAGNKGETKRRVVIIGDDKTAPALRIAKPDTIRVAVNSTFTMPNILSADDLVDGDMKAYVSTNNPVNIAVVGTYTVSFTVSDFSNNDTTVTRTVIVYDDIKPAMVFIGGDTVYHDVHTAFKDSGVILSDNYYSLADLQAALVSSGNVNVDVLGTYKYIYSLTDGSGNGPVTLTRTVIVVDREAPVLTWKGNDADVVKLNVFDTYADFGVAIKDNYYTITSWDTAGTFYTTFPDGRATKLGTYTIIYDVTDPSGNMASMTRTINVVDEEGPVITLKDDPSVTICRWENYTDAGYDMKDNYWPNTDVVVTTEGSFVTKGGTDMPGFYSYRYKAVDKSGNVAYSPYRYIYVNACVSGIDEKVVDNRINIYPNPNSGKFNVTTTLPGSDRVRISVTNALGQEVAVISNGAMGSNTFTVDLSAEANGIYFLKVVSANYSITRQIVINK